MIIMLFKLESISFVVGSVVHNWVCAEYPVHYPITDKQQTEGKMILDEQRKTPGQFERNLGQFGRNAVVFFSGHWPTASDLPFCAVSFLPLSSCSQPYSQPTKRNQNTHRSTSTNAGDEVQSFSRNQTSTESLLFVSSSATPHRDYSQRSIKKPKQEERPQHPLVAPLAANNRNHQNP